MRKLIVLLATLGGLVLFVAPAGAQSPSPSPVYSWGMGPEGGPFTATPTADVVGGPGPAEFSDITTINSNTYVLDSSTGTVWAVGSGGSGLGHGKASSRTSTFVKVKFPKGVMIKSLASVGPDGTEMAIDSNDNVWGWGLNSYYQLCVKGEQYTPIKLTNLPGNKKNGDDYTLASGGGDHASYYNSTNNTIYSCGDNASGELGDGNIKTKPSATPEPVPVSSFDTTVPTPTVTAMTASWEDEGVLMSNGTYWNWGYNGFGQVGDGTTNGMMANADVPTEVTDFPGAPAGYSVVQAAEGGGGPSDGSTMALLSDPSDPGAPYLYYGWGDDTESQLCDGNAATPPNTLEYDTPTPISPSISVDGTEQQLPILSVAAGGETGYVLTTAGAVYGCGANQYGQMGQGSANSTDYLTPTPILAGDTVMQLSSTNWNTAALVTSSG
jgi:alpha-tubulin suppressor-like RCC1 family protein